MRRCEFICGVLLDAFAKQHQRRTAAKRVPPPLPNARGTTLGLGSAGRLPPPPPLPGAVMATHSVLPWKSPQEVLLAFVEYIPTFYVPVHCVAAILSEDCRRHFVGRGRFLSFLKRYRFFFDLRVIDGVRADVKLRDDLNHPRRGVADVKFKMTDVGDVINYVAQPEYIVTMESIEQSNGSVPLKPACSPPAVHVRLEERVPVLERLKALVPVDFALIDQVEESVPEDVLFHPYFDCQGGLVAIASKFPEHFQVVDGMIRRRPLHLAPLALNDFTLDNSPIPDIAKMVQEQVCSSDIPQWVSITSLYEQLTREQKKLVKREFKSFAGFLRAHGMSVSLSQDMLQVAKWIPHIGEGSKAQVCTVNNAAREANETTPGNGIACKDAGGSDVSAANCSTPETVGRVQYEYSQVQIINELFDKFPPNRTLNLVEFLRLVRPDMRPSLPRKVVPWLATYPSYFVLDDPTEKDPEKVRIRRASDRQPLDVAHELYQHIPEEGITEEELLPKLSAIHQDYVKCIGMKHIVDSMPEWLALDTSEQIGKAVLRRLQTEVDLERAICSKETKQLSGSGTQRDPIVNMEEDEINKRWPKLKYEGGMSSPRSIHHCHERE
uniref:Uncharacterized protein n=1 Tax=Trypanosoma congolense (strain IL3000) TaxID=1068625 RepID=G0UNF7_TRYCI|nr:conserved hypothetical protein [Trypanosoma congolense IL3000]